MKPSTRSPLFGRRPDPLFQLRRSPYALSPTWRCECRISFGSAGAAVWIGPPRVSSSRRRRRFLARVEGVRVRRGGRLSGSSVKRVRVRAFFFFFFVPLFLFSRPPLQGRRAPVQSVAMALSFFPLRRGCWRRRRCGRGRGGRPGRPSAPRPAPDLARADDGHGLERGPCEARSAGRVGCGARGVRSFFLNSGLLSSPPSSEGGHCWFVHQDVPPPRAR